MNRAIKIVKLSGWREYNNVYEETIPTAWVIARVKGDSNVVTVLDVNEQYMFKWLIGAQYGNRDCWNEEKELSVEEAMLYDL